MKVFLENLRPGMSPINGKGKFAQRLMRAMVELGVTHVNDADKCDINMRWNTMPSSKHGKRVVRLDGFNFTDANKKRHINNVRKVANNADAVVYQSEISKRGLDFTTGTSASNFRIIPNGVFIPHHVDPVQNIKNEKIFLVACQLLHPIRRTDKLLRVWDKFVDDKDDVALYILYEKKMHDIVFERHKNVFTRRAVPQPELNRWCKRAQAAILLVYQDSCPNFAMECIACGTPVIANNTNGITTFGVGEPHITVANTDDGENFKRRYGEYYYSDFFNDDALLAALNKHYENDVCLDSFPKQFNIYYVAQEYIRLFESLLS